jgi:hypothetical protein
MIRSFLIALLAIFVFIPAVQASDPFESMACRSGTATMVQNSKELMIIGLELKGMLRSNTNSEMLHNVSEICAGIFERTGDEIKQSGYCKYMYLNGDINVVRWDGNGNGGEWKYLLGTGKWENIKGGGTWSMLQRGKSIAPGTFQNCITIKGTFELPKSE